MIQPTVAQRVLEAALASGGDFAEIFWEDTEINQVHMIDDKIDTATHKRRHGAGIRVLCGTNCVYVYTADTHERELLRVARAAAAAVAAGTPAVVLPFAAKQYETVPRIPPERVDNPYRIGLLRRGYRAAREASADISQVSAAIADVDRRIQVCNSEGVFASDRSTRVRLVISAVASRAGEAQTGTQGPGAGVGYEAFERIDIEQAGKRAAEQALTMLSAPECPAGRFPVVIGGGFGGVIFHEACGHSLEATSVSKGNSEFCGKLGQVIAAPCVTAVDDGTIPGEWGSVHIDDEGTPTQKNVLIENGVLKGYMIDRLGSRRMGMPVTGSSRRESYGYAPTSRMTNTYIAAGQDDDEEMLRTMGEGLYARSMGGGSVNPLTGEFNFSVDEGYWVRDGRILTPVRGATLIGKGSQVLTRIDRVGREVSLGQGMCGSVSGNVAVNVGQPQIRVSELTVGGKGEAL